MCSQLLCKVRRRKRYNSYQGEQGRIAPNLLNRQFEADAPNQKWVTDVTEFSVGDRKLYLSPVMDLFDRQINSHTISTSPNLALTNASLKEALACLEPGQQPLVHSDQGIPYQHVTWRTLLKDAGAVQLSWRSPVNSRRCRKPKPHPGTTRSTPGSTPP